MLQIYVGDRVVWFIRPYCPTPSFCHWPKRKKEKFRKMNILPKPYDGVRELIINDLTDCMKAVVSGAAKQEVE